MPDTLPDPSSFPEQARLSAAVVALASVVTDAYRRDGLKVPDAILAVLPAERPRHLHAV